MTLLHRVTLAGLATCLCLAAFPAAAQTASAALKTADGKDAGTVKFAQVPGGVLLTLSVKGLPPGEVMNDSITLDKGKPNSVFDADGSAIVIHASKDDYKSDPAGDAGSRIACGVVQ